MRHLTTNEEATASATLLNRMARAQVLLMMQRLGAVPTGDKWL